MGALGGSPSAPGPALAPAPTWAPVLRSRRCSLARTLRRLQLQHPAGARSFHRGWEWGSGEGPTLGQSELEWGGGGSEEGGKREEEVACYRCRRVASLPPKGDLTLWLASQASDERVQDPGDQGGAASGTRGASQNPETTAPLLRL